MKLRFHIPRPALPFRPLHSSSSTPRGATESRRSAFTLIELLVVIALMATLMTLLAGGIRKSIDSARKRQAATARQAVQTAIMTFWHDNGKPPIDKHDQLDHYYTYIYDWTGKEKEGRNSKTGVRTFTSKALTEVLLPLTDPEHDQNALHKTYLGSSDTFSGKRRMINRITFDLAAKNATVE